MSGTFGEKFLHYDTTNPARLFNLAEPYSSVLHCELQGTFPLKRNVVYSETANHSAQNLGMLKSHAVMYAIILKALCGSLPAKNYTEILIEHDNRATRILKANL